MKRKITALLSVLMLACSGLATAGLSSPSGSGKDRIDSVEMSFATAAVPPMQDTVFSLCRCLRRKA